jgi:PAS domain S-box-containing protein
MVSRNSVLVVDDDPALRTAIAETLRDCGYTPIAVSTTQEALERIAKDKPPVALIDLKLGRGSGMDVIRAVKERDWPTECIVLTARASGSSAIEAFNLGVHGYVQKPFDAEQLMTLIETAIESRRAEEAVQDHTARLEQMERALQRSQEATARSHRLALALSYASEAVQRARTPEEIYCTVLNQVVQLDCHALVFTLTEDGHHLALSYITAKSPLLRAAEKLAGSAEVGFQTLIESNVFHVAVEPDGFHDRLIKENEAVFVDRMSQRLQEDVSDLVDRLSPQSAASIAAERGIYAPLVIGGQIEGLLVVTGATLSRDDVPAVTTFANQIAIALERARLYQEIQESEQRFKAMSASAQDAIIVTDNDGQVTFWNEAAERIFGYAKQDTLGEKVQRLVAPQRYHDDYRRFFETPTTANQEPAVGSTFELMAMKQDGTEFPVEVSLSTAMLRGRLHIIGIIRDISDRKRAERALRESEERYRDLFENAHDLIQSVTPDGRFLYVNRAWRETLGYSKEAVSDLSLFDIIHPDSRPHFMEVLQRVMAGEDARNVEATFIAKDGRELVVEGNVSCRFRNGRPVSTRGIFRDITERKEAEEALRQYAAELEASNEELDAFAHTVAHDLKNPLGNLMGSAEILLESYAELSEDQRQLCLRSISRGSERMSNIINALLLLASVRKIEEIAVEPLDMAHIVAEACERLSTLVDEHQAEIVLPETWPEALGYAPWVEEVWVNYVSNAIKYGGRPPRVELGAAVESASTVRFWVRDNGRGISPEDQARLFTPFTRLNQIQVKGYGLGLSIVQRIVEKLGGQVAVESQTGQGSIFSFILPAISTAA